ncbi:Autophagy-related 14 [Carabus blaptoides fortunei]
MATSSSDESSTAPKDFHLSSSVDSGSRLSPYHYRCQLCNNFRKKFYCKDCIQNGDFVGSSSHYTERFAEKQLRLLKLKSLRRAVEERCCEYLSKKQRIDDVHTKIRQYSERISLLKLLLQDAKDKQDKNKSRLKFLVNEVKASNIRLPKYDDRVEKLERYVIQKLEKVEESRSLLADEKAKLKKLARNRVHQLIEFIFPICQLQPSKSEVESSGELDTVSALAEATRTAYVKGRWVFTDSSGELHHSIVAPTLPGSGDYSAYNLWIAENKDGVPGAGTSSVVDHNPAFNVTAALTYTTQLVNILAFYLDVRLPYKMVYSDFCGNDMNEQQFARRVARLNANVLQLCFSQSVCPEVLHAPRTLHNILQLLNTEVGDLGRLGPIETDPELARSLEDQLAKDLETSEDSGSEDGDTLPYEWEAVPHVQCPEAAAGSATLQSQQMTATQTTSMAGGLVTSAAASIASFWRGWTGK